MARRTLPLALTVFVLSLVLVTLGSRVAHGATDVVASGTTTDATLVSADSTTTTTVADENDDGVKWVVIVGDSLVDRTRARTR
jgi:hypothetical protein